MHAARALSQSVHDRVAAVAPELGERYLDIVYEPDWVQKLYAEQALASGKPDAASRRRRFRRAGPARRKTRIRQPER
jgi:hypothetical protein